MSEHTGVADRAGEQVTVPSDGPTHPAPSPVNPSPLSPRSPGVARDLAALAGLVAVLAFLWGRGGGVWFWLDESISVGIASHPLASIPELLRQDGAPPLYYALLNVWMSLVGSSHAQTHALSLLFALAVVPAALWAGWSLFDRRTGWMCALLAALNPFLAFYANETRMYSLVVLLSLLTTATFLHAFVFGRRRHLVGFVASLTLLLYTHNWGLLLAGAAAVALAPCLLRGSDRKRVVLDAVLPFGAVALLYAPWLPTLLYQWAQDGQPWAQPPTLLQVRDDVAQLFGDLEAVVALGLAGGAAIAAMLRRPWSRSAVALMVLATLPAIVLAAGWASRVWAFRYLAVVAAPLLILAAVGLARGGRVAVAGLAVVAFLTAPIGVKVPPYQKSNAKAVADSASTLLRPGDLVLSPDLQLVPLLANYLPDGLRYATTLGVVPDEHVVDWRHSMDRLRRSDPAETVQPLVEGLPEGRRVLLVCPPITTTGQPTGLAESPDTLSRSTATTAGDTTAGDTTADTDTTSLTVPVPDGAYSFSALLLQRCQQVNRMVLSQPQLRLEMVMKAPTGVYQSPVDAHLLTKVGEGG